MAHSVFTIVASIVPGRVDELDQKVLAHVQANVADFRCFKKLHFASFIIFDRETADPLLVFENSVDDGSDEYLEALIDDAGPLIDAVYGYCVGYPADKARVDKLNYLKARVRWPQLHHEGSRFRTAGSIIQDRELRHRLDARVDALMDPPQGVVANTPTAAAVWRQLQSEFPGRPGREPWLLELLKNLAIMLSPVLVLTPVMWFFWDKHWSLVGLLAAVYALKALWLLTLVGWWPPVGHLKRGVFVPLAAAFGVFIGLWPWHPRLAMLVGVLALVVRGAIEIAGTLPTRRARQTAGNWPIIPLALLAAACSWAPVLLFRSAVRWIGIGAPAWLDVLGTAAVALLVFVAAFVGLTFMSAMPPEADRRFKLRYNLLLYGGGVVGILFWASTKLSCCASWPAAFVLAFASVAGLIGLWDVSLPSPDIDVKPLATVKLNTLENQEDIDVQNHMSVMVRIRRPHRARSILLKVFLHLLDRLFYRTILPIVYKNTLFGVPTVHFAQWTVLDEKRHMFLSNYDLSWSVYLDDFGAQLTTGLQKIWGQSVGNPGVGVLAEFKQFVRTQMVPHQVWYRAYPGLTAEQIKNNEQIRLGLRKTGTDEETCARLLRRLAHIERS